MGGASSRRPQGLLPEWSTSPFLADQPAPGSPHTPSASGEIEPGSPLEHSESGKNRSRSFDA